MTIPIGRYLCAHDLALSADTGVGELEREQELRPNGA